MIRKLMAAAAVTAAVGVTGCEKPASNPPATGTPPPRGVTDPAPATPADLGKGLADATDKAKDAVAGAADKAKDAGKELADKAKDAGKEMADKGKELFGKGKDLLDKGKEAGADVMGKLKETVLKPVTDAMPKIEEKIKGMSGEAGEKAKASYEALKKLVEEFKANPSEALAKKVTEAFEAVKKQVGL